MTSIQELENTNCDLFKTNPQDLIPIVKQLLNLKKFEKALEIAEKAIHYVINNNEGNETNINCAKFYYHYADALIRKCMESDEVLAIPMKEEGEEQNDEEESAEEKGGEVEDQKEGKENVPENSRNNIANSLSNNINSNNHDSPDAAEDEEGEEESEESNLQQDVSDEQVALENLLVAERIYLDHLSKYDSTDPEEIKEKYPEIKQIYFDLGAVYQKLGELQMCKSDFKSAVDFYMKSLKIRQKYDNKFSRAIAELYFEMATAYDFDSKKCLLSYYKTKLIMEYHLKQELIKHNHKRIADQIIIPEEDIDLDSISHNYENLMANRKVTSEITDEQLLKHEDIEELVAIIAELYMKIDDVMIDINDFEKFVQEKKQAQEQKEIQFTNDYDKSKVIDVSNIVRKRPRQEEGTDEKEEGGKRVKTDKQENVEN